MRAPEKKEMSHHVEGLFAALAATLYVVSVMLPTLCSRNTKTYNPRVDPRYLEYKGYKGRIV